MWDDLSGNYTSKNYINSRKTALELKGILLTGLDEDSTIGSSTVSSTSSKRGASGFEFIISLATVVVAIIYRGRRK